jgi:hypothetical protein
MVPINITGNFSNLNVPQYRDMPIQYTTTAVHAISPFEIILIASIFIFLSYWLVRVTRNKEYYEHWKNPNGNEINLYKKVRLLFYLYVGIVILTSCLQIYLSSLR